VRCEATQFVVAATNQTGQRDLYFVLIGRSHGELGRFTACSLPLSSDEMKSGEMRRVIRTLLQFIRCCWRWQHHET